MGLTFYNLGVVPWFCDVIPLGNQGVFISILWLSKQIVKESSSGYTGFQYVFLKSQETSYSSCHWPFSKSVQPMIGMDPIFKRLEDFSDVCPSEKYYIMIRN